VAGVISQELGLEPKLGLVKDMMRRLDWNVGEECEVKVQVA